MSKHSTRNSMTGRFEPKTVEAKEHVHDPEIAPDAPGKTWESMTRAKGRIDTDAAYAPVEPKNHLSKYVNGSEDVVLDDLVMPHRRAIMIDSMTGERLGEQLVRVPQPESVMKRPEIRLLSRRTFGHLDSEDQ